MGFFLSCLDLELFGKIKKDLVSTHTLFTLLLISQDLDKKKIFFVDHQVENVCKISAKNSKLYGSSWNSSNFSIFQTKKTGFLEIIEVCLKLGIGFRITWLVLPNYEKISL